MTSKDLSLALLLSALIVVFPRQSLASGAITPGSPPATANGLIHISSGGGQAIVSYFEANRSYACDALPSTSTSNIAFASQIGILGGAALTVTFRGDTTPAITISGEDSNQANNRIAFTPDASGKYELPITTTVSQGEDVRIDCAETSLYGGYNTNINNFNFLELTNITNQTISGAWTAVNWNGSFFIGTFVIPAGNRQDISLHDVVGAGKYGSLIVTHDGPVGALVGNVSQYKGSATEFSLSATLPLHERVQMR